LRSELLDALDVFEQYAKALDKLED